MVFLSIEYKLKPFANPASMQIALTGVKDV
jgi:hypothetical protein